MDVITIALLAALYSTALQPPAFKASASPVSDAVRDAAARGAKNLIASAELMPADKYAYHPTEPQMTFGQLMVHIVQTNVALCSAISGSPAPMSPDDLKKMSANDAKETIVAAVKRSFDYCSDSVAKVTDAHLADEVTLFGRPTGMSRAATMLAIANDWADHYSTAAAYLRQNGVLPPTAQPKK